MTPTLPAGRYSPAAPTRRRPRVGVLTVLGALAGLAVALLGYRNLASADISAEQLAFELVDDSTVSMRVDVSRDDPSSPAVCILRARSLDGSETGRREVYVPADTADVTTVVAQVRTSAPPVASDVYGCSYVVPPYLVP